MFCEPRALLGTPLHISFGISYILIPPVTNRLHTTPEIKQPKHASQLDKLYTVQLPQTFNVQQCICGEGPLILALCVKHGSPSPRPLTNPSRPSAPASAERMTSEPLCLVLCLRGVGLDDSRLSSHAGASLLRECSSRGGTTLYNLWWT